MTLVVRITSSSGAGGCASNESALPLPFRQVTDHPRGEIPSGHRRAAAGDGFFKILDRALSLLVMTGTSRELTISHGAQFPAQCLLGDDDAEFLEDPDDPPAHDAMHG